MQYKIPINIENEDPIVLGLSIRQLVIIFSWWWLAYAVFTSLSKVVWDKIAFLPAIIIVLIFVAVALFKYSEMTFSAFILNMIRIWVNQQERYWQQWIDSFSALDIWYIANNKNKTEKVDIWNKMEKMKNIEEQLEKI